MKIKIFTLLAAIFLLSNISWGQVGEYRVRKIETITKKIEKPKKPKVIREDNPKREGFFVITEVGFGADNWGGANQSFVLNANGILGYEFNNHFAAGIGIGLNITNYLNLPLYISIRGNITKRPITTNITPYYGVDFGYNIGLIAYALSYDQAKHYNQGILFSPEIGIRTNKIYIGTECMITNHHTNHYTWDNDNIALVISIKLGYKIPLNNIKKFW